jgi:hypothetical protein
MYIHTQSNPVRFAADTFNMCIALPRQTHPSSSDLHVIEVAFKATSKLSAGVIHLELITLTRRAECRPGRRAGQTCQADHREGTEHGRDLQSTDRFMSDQIFEFTDLCAVPPKGRRDKEAICNYC